MDFGWSTTQAQLHEHTLRFARTQLHDDIVRRDRHATFWREGWARCANQGLFALLVPEDYGGAGLDFLTAAHVLEALGQGCRDAGLVFCLHAHTWGATVTVLEYGDEEQRARWLPALANGETVGALAMTETEAGSDAFAMRTRAVRDGDDYVLDGVKTWVTNAPIADLFVVYARTSDGPPLGSISVFVVPRDTPGLQTSATFDMAGLRTAPIGELVLDGCRIPASHRLGCEGGGALLFLDVMERERIGIMASTVGVMQRQLEASVEYARTRKVGGVRISSHQAVSHRLATMRARIESARLLVHRAAWLESMGPSAAVDAALAKLVTSEAAVENALDAIRVHGAMGVTTELGLERELRDAVAGLAYSGTADIQRNAIASYMGLR